MSDISGQLIKDSYSYILQADTSTGYVYRVNGNVPVNPIFSSGLTVFSAFTFVDGNQQNGYVLTSDGSGNSRWASVSGASVASVTASTGLSGNSTTGAITLINTSPDKTVVITGGTNIEIVSDYPNFGINFTGNTFTSGDYLPLSGGTVSGNTIFQSGLTANTLTITGLTSATDSNVVTVDGSGILHTYPISGLTGNTFSGNDGANSGRWILDNTTTPPNPNYFYTTSTDFSALTSVDISITASTNADYYYWFVLMQLYSNGGGGGFLQIQEVGNTNNTGNYFIQSVTNNTTYFTITFVYSSSNGTFTNGKEFTISYVFNGPPGPPGSTGTPGTDGSNTSRWQFSLAYTAFGTPPAGNFITDSTTLSTVTKMSISNTNYNSVDFYNWLTALKNGNQPILQIVEVGTNNVIGTYNVGVGQVVDNTTWFDVPLTFISGGGSLTDTNIYTISWVLSNSGDGANTRRFMWDGINSGVVSSGTFVNQGSENLHFRNDYLHFSYDYDYYGNPVSTWFDVASDWTESHGGSKIILQLTKVSDNSKIGQYFGVSYFSSNTGTDITVKLTGYNYIATDYRMQVGELYAFSWVLLGADGTGGSSGDYLPLSGGTVTGATSFNSGLTANTISGNGSGLTNVILSVSGNTGISATTNNGNVTLINTAQDQTVTISGGTGIVTGGTYPNFTIINTAPDQTVTVTGSTNIQITGNYPNFGIDFTGQTSFPYLPLSGGTVTGNTIFTSGLSANTLSATTYQNLPSSATTFVTGFSYNNNTFTIRDNSGSTFNATINSVTGLTVNGDLNITGTTSASKLYVNDVRITGDTFVTGGTYTNGEISFRYNTGGGFVVNNLPIGGGGGQVYYFNLSKTQTPYKEFATTATTASEQQTGVTISQGVTNTIASFLTPVGYPNKILIPGGNWTFYLHSYKENNNTSFDIFCEVWKRTSGGTETLLFTTDAAPVTTNSPNPSMQISDGYYSGTTLNTTDRILVKVRATNTSNQSHTITFVTEGAQHYSYGITTFSQSDLLTCETLSGCSIIQTIQTDVSNKVNRRGDTMTGTLNVPTISATTYQNLPSYISATTLSSANVLSVTMGGGSPNTSTVNAVTGGSYSSGIITLSGTGSVNGTQITGLTQGTVTSLNTLTGATQTFGNDTNVTIVSSGTTHTLTWSGTLADARIASATNWNTAYTNRITTLTVTGNSGSATLSSNTLNIPTYTLAGLSGITLTSLSFAAGSGGYNNTTGVITIPTNNNQITNGSSFITLGSLSGTSPINYNSGTGVISMAQSSGSVNGYLSATDWTTFNNKGAGTVTSVSGTIGRITSTGGVTPALDLTSGIATPGTTGSSTLIPVITIDTYGRVTSISTASNPQGTVTSVSGTTPIVSSGGNTPAISIPAATTSVNGYLTSTDWTTFNNKQNTSIPAFTINANNTSAAANVQSLTYKDLGEQSYTDTITWTAAGGSAPSGIITTFYRWSQIGRTVNYNFYFYYTTASSLATAITFPLPSAMPNPESPTGNLGTGSYLYKSNNVIALNQIAALTYQSGGLRKSATGFEWNITAASGTYRFVEVTGTYFTP